MIPYQKSQGSLGNVEPRSFVFVEFGTEQAKSVHAGSAATGTKSGATVGDLTTFGGKWSLPCVLIIVLIA